MGKGQEEQRSGSLKLPEAGAGGVPGLVLFDFSITVSREVPRSASVIFKSPFRWIPATPCQSRKCCVQYLEEGDQTPFRSAPFYPQTLLAARSARGPLAAGRQIASPGWQTGSRSGGSGTFSERGSAELVLVPGGVCGVGEWKEPW